MVVAYSTSLLDNGNAMRQGPEPNANDCPLCARLVAAAGPRLYGVAVCRGCSRRFAARRSAAAILDMLLFYLLLPGACVGLSYAIAVYWPFTRGGLIDALVVLAIVVVCLAAMIPPLLYFAKDGCAGYSPGKWLCGLRVVDARTGRPIGVAQSSLRNMLLGCVPPLGLLMFGQVRRGPRWGDALANTRVVWTRYADSPVFQGQRFAHSARQAAPAETSVNEIHQGV